MRGYILRRRAFHAFAELLNRNRSLADIGRRPAPCLRASPAARLVGASPAAPLGGIRQHEQVQTGEQEQSEYGHCR